MRELSKETSLQRVMRASGRVPVQCLSLIHIYIKLEDIPEVKRRIRERFGIPNHTTVNGETDCYIREEDMELLRETEKRGFIQIRNKPA